MDRIEYAIESLKMLIIVGVITIVGNTVGYDTGIVNAVPGILMIIVIGLMSLILAREIPVNFPGIAWAILIATILSLPFSPVQESFLEAVGEIEFLATATPILAYAGLSVAMQYDRLKKISWKIVIVTILSMLGTFIGSVLIAEAVLRAQGII